MKTKKETTIIKKFILLYDSHNEEKKKIIRETILEKCGFTKNTFYYKLKNENYSKTEIEVLSMIITKKSKSESNTIKLSV